jgi:hypothetical protein
MTKQIKRIPMTASWSTRLPDCFARIGISRGRPRRQSGYRAYSPLVPGVWWNKVDLHDFYTLYIEQLTNLNPEKVLRDLNELAGERIPVLLCFERLDDHTAYCHRAFVSSWLKETLHIDIAEYGADATRVGCNHPKFPPSLRTWRPRSC